MILLTFLLFFGACEGARILAFLPLNVTSHQTTYRPLFRRLAAKGHDVTFVTSLPDTTAPYKQIVIKYEEISTNVDYFALRNSNWLSEIFLFTDFSEEAIHTVFQHPEVQALINSTEVHFDLVVTESSLLQYAYIVLGHRFNAHVVELQATCSTFWLDHLIGNPYSFSYSVDLTTYSSDRMTFWERMHNTVMGITTLLIHRFYVLPRQETLVNRYLRYPGWEGRPPLLELMSNISLIILNTHIATHYPRPLNPNVVEIAGIQVPEKKPLPQDLQTFLDNAKEGAIYFSLGSAIKGCTMPEKIRQAFTSAFRKLNYKILWKWETEFISDKPRNVKLSKWLPQSDVLAHPNVKLFITHGGIISLTETVYHGVPTVTIPLFLDQWKNSKQMESAGYGFIVNFDSITEELISRAINTVLSEPSYREAAQRQSEILRDNPLSPIDNVVYWIEYVLRHKGAPHLRTAAASLPWYKYYLIDVAAVLISAVILVLLLVLIIIKAVLRFIFRRKSEQSRVKMLKKEKIL